MWNQKVGRAFRLPVVFYRQVEAQVSRNLLSLFPHKGISFRKCSMIQPNQKPKNLIGNRFAMDEIIPTLLPHFFTNQE